MSVWGVDRIISGIPFSDIVPLFFFRNHVIFSSLVVSVFFFLWELQKEKVLINFLVFLANSSPDAIVNFIFSNFASMFMPPDVFAQNILSCTLCDFPALIMARSNFLYQNCAHKSLHHSFNCEHFHALLFDTSSPEIHNVCMFYYCLWCISSLIRSLSLFFIPPIFVLL